MSVKHWRTGRNRVRVHPRLFRQPLLVVQVEMRAKGYQVGPYIGMGSDVDYKYWRDAEVTDFRFQHIDNITPEGA